MSRIEFRAVKDMPGFRLDVRWEMGDELLVLFGYSGSGKSVSLQMLTGIATPDSGYIAIDGEVLLDTARRVSVPPQRRGIGYVSQNLALFPHMTVAGNIAYGMSGDDKGASEGRVAELVRLLHLDGLEHRLPHAISGGQQQRVALARALAARPRLLVLDEPFSALDNPLRDEMRGVIADIRRTTGIPVVLVTHDIHEAFCMGDRIVVYSKGRVKRSGTPDELNQGRRLTLVKAGTTLQDSVSVTRELCGDMDDDHDVLVLGGTS